MDAHVWAIEANGSSGRMFNVYQDHEFWGVMDYGWCYSKAEGGTVLVDRATGQPWRPEV